jgi:hypothetical protein
MPNSIKFCLVILLLTLFQQTLPAQGRPWPVNYGYTPDKDFLWRLDGRKTDVAIYDDMLRPGVHHLIMVIPGPG